LVVAEVLVGLVNKNLFRYNRDMLEEVRRSEERSDGLATPSLVTKPHELVLPYKTQLLRNQCNNPHPYPNPFCDSLRSSQLELTFPDPTTVDVEGGELGDEDGDPDSVEAEEPDPMAMALKSSEIGTLLSDTAELAKLLTTKSPHCALLAFDSLENLLTLTLTKISTTYDPEDSWDALAILYLFETSVAASALLHSAETHFRKFLELSKNLLNFTQQLSNSKAWTGQPAIVNIVVACASALSSMNQVRSRSDHILHSNPNNTITNPPSRARSSRSLLRLSGAGRPTPPRFSSPQLLS